MFLYDLALNVSNTLEHNEKDLKDVESFFKKSGSFISNIENNNYYLIEFNDDKVHYIAIFTKENSFCGWLDYTKQENIFIINKIYILKEFRNKQIAKILLFWVRSIFQKSLFLGGAIFKDGQNLIRSLEKDNRFEICLFDLKDKNKSEFNFDQLFKKKTLGILIENWEDVTGIYENNIPGKKSNFLVLSYFVEE